MEKFIEKEIESLKDYKFTEKQIRVLKISMKLAWVNGKLEQLKSMIPKKEEL